MATYAVQTRSRAPRRSMTGSSRVIPPIEWPAFADDIDAILELKRQRNAVILAHNYQTPEIFHCVADIVGDSLALAREATQGRCRCHRARRRAFHGRDREAAQPGQDRADPRPARPAARWRTRSPRQDVRLLRQRYPGVPVVTYVNTSAAVKAESDICCTSGNALAVVESLGAERVIMLPDEYLAQNIAAQTEVKIIAWKGHCEVHERFTAADVRQIARRPSRRHRARASRVPARGRRRSGLLPARPRRCPTMSASSSRPGWCC